MIRNKTLFQKYNYLFFFFFQPETINLLPIPPLHPLTQLVLTVVHRALLPLLIVLQVTKKRLKIGRIPPIIRKNQHWEHPDRPKAHPLPLLKRKKTPLIMKPLCQPLSQEQKSNQRSKKQQPQKKNMSMLYSLAMSVCSFF